MAHHEYSVTEHNGLVRLNDETDGSYLELPPKAAMALAGQLIASAYDAFGQPVPKYIHLTDSR